MTLKEICVFARSIGVTLIPLDLLEDLLQRPSDRSEQGREHYVISQLHALKCRENNQ